MKAETRKFVESRVEAGKSYAQIISLLIGMDLASNRIDAEKILKEAKVEKAPKKGDVDQFYSWLETGKKTEIECKDYILAHMSKTNIAITSFHQRTRVMVNRLLDKVEQEKVAGPVEQK